MELLEKKIDALTEALEDGLQFLTVMTKEGFAKVATKEDLFEMETKMSAEFEKYIGSSHQELDSHAARIKDLEAEVWPNGKPEPAH